MWAVEDHDPLEMLAGADVLISPLLLASHARKHSHQLWGNTQPCHLTCEEHREFLVGGSERSIREGTHPKLSPRKAPRERLKPPINTPRCGMFHIAP